jgi:hypothetical protein
MPFFGMILIAGHGKRKFQPNQEGMAMTLEQLERRVNDLEVQISELRSELKPLRSLGGVQETFGMFAVDPEFDEIVRQGREYRKRANSEGE